MGSILSGIFGTNDSYQYDPNSAGTQGIINQNYTNQNALASQLLAQSQGHGPNLAQNMLNQATDQNTKNTAAQIAGQKGINAGLAQRLIAQNGAQQAQSSAGQAATLNAQQQLSAQNQLSGLYGQIGNQGITQQNAANSVNAGVAAQNSQSAGQLAGGLLGGIGAVGGGMAMGSALKKAHGGYIPGKANVPGDSPKNDTVPVAASPGEIVIPRSKASDPEKAKAFIDELMSKKKTESKNTSFAEIATLKRKVLELEKKVKGK